MTFGQRVACNKFAEGIADNATSGGVTKPTGGGSNGGGADGPERSQQGSDECTGGRRWSCGCCGAVAAVIASGWGKIDCQFVWVLFNYS